MVSFDEGLSYAPVGAFRPHNPVAVSFLSFDTTV